MTKKPKVANRQRTTDAGLRRVQALRDFANSPFFAEVMLELKEQSWFGRLPFDAALTHLKACALIGVTASDFAKWIEGHQALFTAFDERIRAAQKWQRKQPVK